MGTLKTVVPVALAEVLRQRKESGADRFDEMWDGVLHMPPAPNAAQQGIAAAIAAFFLEVWEPLNGGLALVHAKVSIAQRWDRDYRIPDVAVLTAENRPHPSDAYVRPATVFEVRSPDEDVFDKLPFYAAAGVQAVVVVERDTRACAVFSRSGDRLFLTPRGADGWKRVEALKIEVRSEDRAGEARLGLRLADLTTAVHYV